MMKKLSVNICIAGLFASLMFVNCSKDNYKEPSSVINGRVVHKGTALSLRGTGEAVQLQLFQKGYPLQGHVPVYVGQDGKFSVKVGDGDYKLVARNNNGPWVNAKDTLHFQLRGNMTIDYEVQPFFWLNDVKIALENQGKLTASFTVDKLVSTATVDYAMLLIGKTGFVDDATNIFRKDFSEVQTDFFESEDITNILNENSNLFVRVGLRTAGSDQAIYSEVVRIK